VTAAEQEQHAIEQARESRLAQGLEEHVTDVALLGKIAALIGGDAAGT
jgi:hypothetical protein